MQNFTTIRSVSWFFWTETVLMSQRFCRSFWMKAKLQCISMHLPYSASLSLSLCPSFSSVAVLNNFSKAKLIIWTFVLMRFIAAMVNMRWHRVYDRRSGSHNIACTIADAHNIVSMWTRLYNNLTKTIA